MNPHMHHLIHTLLYTPSHTHPLITPSGNGQTHHHHHHHHQEKTRKNPKSRKLKTENNKHGMAVQKTGIDRRAPGSIPGSIPGSASGLLVQQNHNASSSNSSSNSQPTIEGSSGMPSTMTSYSSNTHSSDRLLSIHHPIYEVRDEMDENSSSSGSSSEGDGDGDDNSQNHLQVHLTTATTTNTNNNTTITTNTNNNSNNNTNIILPDQRVGSSPGISADATLPVPSYDRSNRSRGSRAKEQGLPPPDFL